MTFEENMASVENAAIAASNDQVFEDLFQNMIRLSKDEPEVFNSAMYALKDMAHAFYINSTFDPLVNILAVCMVYGFDKIVDRVKESYLSEEE
jgi:hypothetical protein